MGTQILIAHSWRGFYVCFQSQPFWQEVDEVQSFIDAAIRLGFSPSKYKPLQLIGSTTSFFEVFLFPLFSSLSLWLFNGLMIDVYIIYFFILSLSKISSHTHWFCINFSAPSPEAKSLVMALPWPTPWGAPGRASDEGVLHGGCLEVAATHRRCREKWNRCGWNTASSLLNWIWRCLLQWTMCWTCHLLNAGDFKLLFKHLVTVTYSHIAHHLVGEFSRGVEVHRFATARARATSFQRKNVSCCLCWWSRGSRGIPSICEGWLQLPTDTDLHSKLSTRGVKMS